MLSTCPSGLVFFLSNTFFFFLIAVEHILKALRKPGGSLCGEVNLTWVWRTPSFQSVGENGQKNLLPVSKKTTKKEVCTSFLSWSDPWVMADEERGGKSHELIDFCLQKKHVNSPFQHKVCL